ncbi:hypothetical protein BDZ94DRAFT_1253911 [Collybia nuda]|uniref:Uncharacterized protein n=1 Tax=Collybia nuda TaxID=64659 RepID=A0A9P5YCR7_9AGAR|nr:hypothetical protein BDZ94DRAFT_1253911 [Collybia nuda]
MRIFRLYYAHMRVCFVFPCDHVVFFSLSYGVCVSYGGGRVHPGSSRVKECK